MKTILSAASIIIVFISCINQEPKKQDPKKNDSIVVVSNTITTKDSANNNEDYIPDLFEPYKADNYFNNVTAVMCGLKGQAHNLNYLFDSAAWARNGKYIDSSWARVEKNRLRAMRGWAAKEFAKPNANTKIVFYPFSGPDILTATTFFPNADKYIMLGLEPIGKLPDFKKFKKGEHAEYAADFKHSLEYFFAKSYFITKKMLNDFQTQKVNGLLPVLTLFIRKSGCEISNIKYIVRYEQDSMVEVSYNYKNPDHKPTGVRVDFIQNGKPKSVYYFRYDVSDKKFNDTCIFYRYLNKNKNYITYIKSASYLLHANFMSNMRKMILKNSKCVVQDDTGIPFKYFSDGKDWDIKIYGAYSKPVSDFPYLSMQKPLEEAFKKDSANIGKLPFHLGYHWGSKKDVIIYAFKK